MQVVDYNIALIVRRICSGFKTGADAPINYRPIKILWSGWAVMRLLFTLLSYIIIMMPTVWAVPPGTIITNVASGSYSSGNVTDVTVLSNEVITITTIPQTSSTVELLMYNPGSLSSWTVDFSTTFYSLSGLSSGLYSSLPNPMTNHTNLPIDISSPVPIVATDLYFRGDPAFIILNDYDQNIDTLLIDSVLLTVSSDLPGENEVLKVFETDVNSGQFTGYIQTVGQLTAVPHDGALGVVDGNNIYVDYVDDYNPTDISADTARIISFASSLFMNKQADKNVVSVGDFVQYQLTLDNVNSLPLGQVSVTDVLPFGVEYKSGSSIIDGQAVADPIISNDKRTITYYMGQIDENSHHEIRYVTEIMPVVMPGFITNTAWAHTPFDERSNIASASVKVVDDLLTNRNIIIGQVAVVGCNEADTLEIGRGVKGVRIYLEDGSYTVTDDSGRFHFEGVLPGMHVVQLDSAGLNEKYEISKCYDNYRFAGRRYSQFVDLKPGTMWRTDFYLHRKPDPPPPNGLLNVELSHVAQDSLVEISVKFIDSIVAIDNIRLSLNVPQEIQYQNGSSRWRGDSLPDPVINGSVYTYRIDSLDLKLLDELTFSGIALGQQQSKELTVEAIAIFDSPDERNIRSKKFENIIDLKYKQETIRKPSITLRPKFASFSHIVDEESIRVLDKVVEEYRDKTIVQIQLTGHTDSDRINPRSRHIFADNYALSIGRATSVGEYFRKAFGLDEMQMIVEGKGFDEPLATNSTAEGKYLNRRVEVVFIVERQLDIYNLVPVQPFDSLVFETEGIVEDTLPPKPWEVRTNPKVMPEINKDWLADAKAGRNWIWPDSSYFPAIPSTKIAVKHYPEEAVKLYLNGEEVSMLNFVGSYSDDSAMTAATVYSGIDLIEGFNNFEAVLINKDGEETYRMERKIYYSSPSVRGELIDSLSYLVADGRNPLVVAIKMTDVNGYPARTGVIGEFMIEPPYISYRDLDLLRKQSPTEQNHNRSTYVVVNDGIAYIKLEPTSHTGEGVMRFKFVDNEQEIRFWTSPDEREMVMVGLAHGTIGYNWVKDNLQSFNDAGYEDKFYHDGRLAFFARGRIKGQWLLTLALDTDNRQKDSTGMLFGTIDPDEYYTVYGDGSRQQYDAPTSEKLYLKVERGRFYALFGDHHTGLTVTELAKYNRSFTGFKSEYHGQKGNVNLYLNKSKQSFIKDEMQGDGTSGLYYLSHNNIVVNSDKLLIEIRDRYQSEVVLSRRELIRHLDYNIDYTDGTIFFKEPIPSRDFNMNPVIIITEYETADQTDADYNYGGRGSVYLYDKKLEAGGSYLHEGRGVSDADLGAVDLTYRINQNSEIKTELATSKINNNIEDTTGSAVVLEAKHRVGQFTGVAYMRYLSNGFGLGQQNRSETGTRKIGLDLKYQSNKTFNYSGTFFRQYNLASGTKRDMVDVKSSYQIDNYSIRGGLRFAQDKLIDNSTSKSVQLNFGGSYKLLNKKLKLRFDREQSLGKSNNNAAFPTRTILGVEYTPLLRLTIYGTQEITDGDNTNSINSRIGLRSRPWLGSDWHSAVDRRFNDDGVRLFSVIGLKQTFRLNSKWSIDFSVDINETISKTAQTPFNINQTPVIGSSEDFQAYSVGFGYRSKMWSWSNRFEYRAADSKDKATVVNGLYGEPRPGLGVSFGSQLFFSKLNDGHKQSQGQVKLGFAVRPNQSAWIWLNRLEFKFDEVSDSTFAFDRRSLINYMHLNYEPTRRFQAAMIYNARISKDKIADFDYEGFSDMLGLEIKLNFSNNWDLGLSGSTRHSWKNDLYDFSGGASVGHNVAQNSWVSIGYNLVGYRDLDFSESSYTGQGIYLTFRFKFDQLTAKQILEKLNW